MLESPPDPAFLMRTHDMFVGKTGYWFGVCLLARGSAGLLARGAIIEYCFVRGHKDACIKVLIASAISIANTGLPAPLMATKVATIALLVPFVFL